MTDRRGVLFVCLGNVCRSPMAEAIFAQLITERQLTNKWFSDSASINAWKIGKTPDERAINVLKRYNIETSHRVRLLCGEDFNKYEYIFGMDQKIIDEINAKTPVKSTAKIELLGTYDPEKQLIIKDTYHDSGDDGFVTTYEHCLRCLNAFLDQFQ